MTYTFYLLHTENLNFADTSILLETETSIVSLQDNLVAQQSFPSQGQAKRKQQKKQGNQKNVAHRGIAFSKEEDAMICSAFLHISKDPIAGTNQNAGTYYKRMYDFFSENKPGHSRSQIGIQKRWLLIQNRVSLFCALKSRVDRRNESGKNEQDRVRTLIMHLCFLYK